MDMSICRNQVTEDELDEIIDKFSVSEEEEDKRCQKMWKAAGVKVTPMLDGFTVEKLAI